LRAACNGLPGAVIAWPHRILHEAAEELAAANARIAELAGELGDGTCEWWEDGEMWESSCGVAYMFNSDGPEDNGHRFCHKCGKRIAIDEARGSMIVR
jgi:hypothetical protein